MFITVSIGRQDY